MAATPRARIWIDAYLQGIFRREVRHRIELQHSSTSIYRSKQISFVWSGNAEMAKQIGLGPPILHLGASVVAFCIVGKVGVRPAAFRADQGAATLGRIVIVCLQEREYI